MRWTHPPHSCAQSDFQGEGKSYKRLGGSSSLHWRQGPAVDQSGSSGVGVKWMDLRCILLLDQMWAVKKRENSNICLQQLCGCWCHFPRWGSLRWRWEKVEGGNDFSCIQAHDPAASAKSCPSCGGLGDRLKGEKFFHFHVLI